MCIRDRFLAALFRWLRCDQMDAEALYGAADLDGLSHGFLAQLPYHEAPAGNNRDISVLGKALQCFSHGSAGNAQFL